MESIKRIKEKIQNMWEILKTYIFSIFSCKENKREDDNSYIYTKLNLYSRDDNDTSDSDDSDDNDRISCYTTRCNTGELSSLYNSGGYISKAFNDEYLSESTTNI